MQNNRKKHTKIDNSISSEEIFVWLNAVNSDDEEVIDQLMNDFDINPLTTMGHLGPNIEMNFFSIFL